MLAVMCPCQDEWILAFSVHLELVHAKPVGNFICSVFSVTKCDVVVPVLTTLCTTFVFLRFLLAWCQHLAGLIHHEHLCIMIYITVLF